MTIGKFSEPTPTGAFGTTIPLPNLKGVIGLAIVAILILSSGCMYSSRNLSRVISDTPIKSLDFSTQIHGSFILGSGSVNERSYYFYYVVEPDGGYSLQKAPTDYSKIYMDSDISTAHLVVLNAEPNPYNCQESASDAECKADGDSWVFSKEYQFHVPNGTITQRYNADVNGGTP